MLRVLHAGRQGEVNTGTVATFHCICSMLYDLSYCVADIYAVQLAYNTIYLIYGLM
jgi:hypothetical protein